MQENTKKEQTGNTFVGLLLIVGVGYLTYKYISNPRVVNNYIYVTRA